MSRYIDADKACEIAIAHKDFGQCIADLVSLKEVLRDTPTEDVVKVVRCKDCKYFVDKQSENHQGICMCGEKIHHMPQIFILTQTIFVVMEKGKMKNERICS